MNINPLTWLVVVAPAAALGAALFIWVYQDNTATADLERDRLRLESMEFDQSFAQAWNGQKITAPSGEDMARLRERIEQKEAAAELAAAQRCAKLAAVAGRLDSQLGATGGKASPKTDPDCQGIEIEPADEPATLDLSELESKAKEIANEIKEQTP